MKLMYALIIAVLFLTACQLVTTDGFRGKQNLLERMADRMRDSRNFKLAKRCKPVNYACSPSDAEKCCGVCEYEGIGRGWCAYS
uniref:Conotoxin n=1 Tax=Conus betulinus TaxID=89764 RepID=A0A142C1M4_CONBE|nr:conotoxin [Conus betulinus]